MSSYCRSFTVWYSAAAKEDKAHEDSTDVVQEISCTNVNVYKHIALNQQWNLYLLFQNIHGM